jgi:hypothetical protein
MALIKRALARAFTRCEAVFEYAFGQRNNPFVWLGALGWYFYWIVAATGVYLYIFFSLTLASLMPMRRSSTSPTNSGTRPA